MKKFLLITIPLSVLVVAVLVVYAVTLANNVKQTDSYTVTVEDIAFSAEHTKIFMR